MTMIVFKFMSLPSLPTPSTDQLIVVNLAAILVGTTFNSPQKVFHVCWKLMGQ